jgi:mRNA interferase MazF
MLTKRGDVIRVLFPNSDLTTAKRRPALVIQADSLNAGLGQTIMAMITSNMARANHPSRVTVMASSIAGVGAGLRLDSVIMTDNLVTVANTEIDSALGRLPMAEVDAALRHTLGL